MFIDKFKKIISVNFVKNGFMLLMAGMLCMPLVAQEPYRVGTTTANFLEIGAGSDGLALGEAGAALTGNISSIYWNIAGLAFLEGPEMMFMQQPWVVDINTNAIAGAWGMPALGTFAFSIYQVNYGDMKVTTLDRQDGTGEYFTANEYSFQLGYARKLAQWFAFGGAVKYIRSQIWHSSAGAVAVDLGGLVMTPFFSPTGKQEDALKIGISISNYGTRMRYDGIDLVYPIDISEDEAGNFRYAAGQFRMDEWELPLIFRIGLSLNPIHTRYHSILLTTDMLHPNNNNEYINVGSQYELKLPGTGSLFLRAGYKGIFMDESQYGLTFGGGIKLNLMGNAAIKIDYAFRDMGVLGTPQAFTFGLVF